jgi:hypothetical protein
MISNSVTVQINQTADGALDNVVTTPNDPHGVGSGNWPPGGSD